MADLTYDVQVNVSDATRNLDKLNTKVSNVNKAFGAFRNALAGIAIGSFISSTLKWADAISDLSDATGIAVENIQGFSSAVVASGGNAEGAQKAILQLVQSIGEAAEGSAKVQYAFEQVGVSLNDLKTLSEQQILQRVVDGLAGISDKAKQARLSNELLGKSLRGVELKGLASAYPGAVVDARASSSAVKAAAGAQQALERNLENLRVALVNVLEPLNKLVAGVNITAKGFEYLLIAVAAGTAVFLYYTRGITPLIGLLKGLGNALLFFSTGAVGLLTKTMGLLSRAFYVIAGPLINFGKALKQIFVVGAASLGIFDKLRLAFAAFFGIVGPLIARLAGIAGIVYTLAQAFAFLDETLNKGRAVKWITEQWNGLISVVDKYYNKAKAALGLSGAPAEQPRNPQPSGPTNPRRYPGQNEFVAGQAQATRDVKDRNAELRASIIAVGEAYKNKTDDMRKSLSLDLIYLKMTEDEAAATRAYNEVMNEAQKEIQALIDKKKALKPEEQSVIPTINAQIAAIRDRAEISAAAAAQAVIDTNNFVHAQEQMRRELEITGQKAKDNLQLDEMSAQLQTIGLYGDALTETNSLLAAEYELKAKLLDIELRRQQVMAAKPGPEALAQEIANLAKEETAARNYADRRVEIDKERLEKEEALRQNGKAGALQYFEDLKRSVDPFQVALDSVSSVFGNMESALDTFVKTGKFKFKDFAMSIIRDLIMIQLRAAMAGIFRAIGLAFLAGGGPATAGKSYIVGEKGPELFVPKSAGTIIPNNKIASVGSGSGGSSNSVVNYITNNNVSAVDGQSVARFFAENRRTLLGSMQLAQKELPYGNR
jgi:lambda family phage tail tape measure protein